MEKTFPKKMLYASVLFLLIFSPLFIQAGENGRIQVPEFMLEKYQPGFQDVMLTVPDPVPLGHLHSDLPELNPKSTLSSNGIQPRRVYRRRPVMEKRILIGIRGGLSVFTGMGSELFNLGFNLNGNIGFLVTRYLELGFHLIFDSWGISGSVYSTTVWQYLGYFRFFWSINPVVRSFTHFGLGNFNYGVDAPGEFRYNEFGFVSGVGLEIGQRINSLRFEILMLYHYMGEGDRWFSFSGGIVIGVY